MDLGGPRPRTVFALLLVEAGRAVSTDRLVDETWNGSPPPGARRTLQSYVARMRRALGDDGPLGTATGGYVLDEDRISVDIRVFEQRANEAREVAASTGAKAAAQVLRNALDLWTGEPFADLPVDDVPTLATERTRLVELRMTVVEQRIDADLASGRHREVVGELEKLVTTHPERERLWAQLMVALHESGRSSEALAAARRPRQYMATEMGSDPGDHIRRLEGRIAARHPAVPVQRRRGAA